MQAPPECQNARAAEVPGALNWQQSDEHQIDTPDHTSAQEVSEVSSQVSLPDFTARQIILDWYMDWRTRCDRYQLAAETIGLSDEKREELEHEGQVIGRIMLAIGPEAQA